MARATVAVINKETGQTTKRIHHCTECRRPWNQECIEKIHQSYCTVCKYRFQVKSQGCDRGHYYRDGYNLEVLEERMAIDPSFKRKTDYGVEEDNNDAAEEEEEEEKPFDTDWSKPAYKPDREPKAKTKETQGKKSQKKPMTAKEVLLERKTKVNKKGGAGA